MPIGPLSTSNLPAVYFDGMWRVLGCIPSTQESLKRFAKFSSHFQASLDPTQWREIELTYATPILNQGQTSSCTAHASTSGSEMSWMQSGRPLHEFSPWFLYSLIDGGRDAGSSISDAMTALMTRGICSKELVSPGTILEQQLSQNAFADAANYKVIKAYHCPTFEDICSAITLGFPTVLGMYVGNNFPQLNAQGVAPMPNGGGGGHALLGMGLKKIMGQWFIKLQNSWGPTFGANVGMSGHCYITKAHLQYMQPDGVALQTMGGADPETPVVNN